MKDIRPDLHFSWIYLREDTTSDGDPILRIDQDEGCILLSLTTAEELIERLREWIRV